MEVWKNIPNYEGMYQISNLGNVKSLPREVLKKGKYPFICKEKILKNRKDGAGYLCVALFKNSKRKDMCVHQLVAIVFLNHTICGYNIVVDHIDSNPLNNRVENLRLITQRENTYRVRDNYSSKHKGVCWKKQAKKWQASITINGKTKYLGLFISEYSAHLAYQNKLKEIL